VLSNLRSTPLGSLDLRYQLNLLKNHQQYAEEEVECQKKGEFHTD